MLDMKKETFGQVARAGTARERMVHIVARLLAVALKRSEDRNPQDSTLTWPMPERYRAWPMVESRLSSSGRCWRARFYVAPKAAELSEGAPFPIATVFVVETSYVRLNDEQRVSYFVMGKYADMATGHSARGLCGRWASATYGPDGELLVSDAISCETVRLLQARVSSWRSGAGRQLE
jgi:hypothetical protein